MQTENLLNLKLHKMSNTQYKREQAVGNLDSAAIYLTPEEPHTHSVTHTPAGSVSQPTFTGTKASHTHAFSGSASHDHTFTGTGTLIKATFTGTEQTASVSYTPAGTVSKPRITVTPTTTDVYSITGVGTLPSATFTQGSGSFSATITNKIVKFSHGHTKPSLTFSAGTLPTRSSTAVKAITSVSAALSTAPTFTGTTATISHKHTPAGTIKITAAAPGTGETANYTPAGTIASKSVTISGTSGSTEITPAGTVSKPTFTGTAATLTTTANT